MSVGGIPAQPKHLESLDQPPVSAAEVGSPAAVPSQGGAAPPVSMASDYVELQRPAAEARNPLMESRAEARAQKEQFMGGLKKGGARAAQGPKMGPAEGSQPPGLGQQISDALGKLGQDGAGLAGELGGLSPLALGGLFAQAPPEQMAAWLNGLGAASEADKRELMPKVLEALQRAQPPARLSEEVLGQLEGSTLRALAAHTGGEEGAKGLARSGLLGALAGKDKDHAGNAMAALEGISRLGAKDLPGALKAAGLDEQKLVKWVQEAGKTDPMALKGGWVNPETVGRLAGKLAEQSGGAGLGSAVALSCAALEGRAEKGLAMDEGLQQGLESVLKKTQGSDVPQRQKAEAAKALIDSGLFGHPQALSPELREQSTALVASAGQELTQLYVQNSPNWQVDSAESERLGQMVQALGFTGPEGARQNFNTMWGNLIGATLKTAVDFKDLDKANEAGMLLEAYSNGAMGAQANHDSRVKAWQDMLGFAVSGIGGGFSWKMGAYNLVSPLKEGGKSLAQDLAKSLVGDNPDATKLVRRLEDRLLDEAGSLGEQRGLSKSDWGDLRRAFQIVWRLAMHLVQRGSLALFSLVLLAVGGCGKRTCQEEPNISTISDARGTGALLQSFLQDEEQGTGADLCPVVDLLDHSPEIVADWFASLQEEDLAVAARQIQKVVREYDERTATRVSGSLGSVLGVMLQRMLTAKDLALAFRSGLLSFHAWAVLQSTGRQEREAFESEIQRFLGIQAATSKPASMQSTDAWGSRSTFEDSLLDSAGEAAARDMDRKTWGNIRRAVQAGFSKAADPSGWETRFENDPVVRGLIEKDYHTTFKTPLAVATP